jgi:hypothetical protein
VVSLGSASSTLWVTVLPAGISRRLPDGELLHVYLSRGIVEVETIGRLQPGDSLRLSDSAQLRLSALTEVEVLVWEMAGDEGERR